MMKGNTEVWQDQCDAARPWIVSVDDHTISVHRTEKAAERTAGTVRRLLARGTHPMNLVDRLRGVR
jgi:hypothetical protein